MTRTLLSKIPYLLLFGFVSLVSPASFSAQIIIPAAPQLAAKAYLLIDATTGAVLVSHEADKPLAPASLTKMMTSYIASEEILSGRLKETDLVRISDNAWKKGGTSSGGSTMFLKTRSEVSVIDLMRGVIIQSGNDASIALAEHIAGSEGAFAEVMNQQAKLIGMNNTHFVNATGWPAEGHVTTAEDLALLARAVIRDHPEHYAIYSERYFKHNGINQSNRNRLLFTNKNVDGLKTGHTEEAGFCLVSSEKRKNMRLIAVVMGTKTKQARSQESERLLSYGFRYYETVSLYSGGVSIDELTQRIWGGLADKVDLQLKDDIVVTIPRGSRKQLKVETQIDSVIKAPVQTQQILGKLLVNLDDKVISEQALVAAATVERSGFFARTWDSLMLMVQGE